MMLGFELENYPTTAYQIPLFIALVLVLDRLATNRLREGLASSDGANRRSTAVCASVQRRSAVVTVVTTTQHR
jgi:hypothetical protein